MRSFSPYFTINTLFCFAYGKLVDELKEYLHWDPDTGGEGLKSPLRKK